ncbi:TPA: hypothetical protein ACN397_004601 [Vibrio parahaemolyticus]
MFTAQWFSLGGMRCSPLNAALYTNGSISRGIGLKSINIVTLPVYRIEKQKYYDQRELFVEKSIFGGPDGQFKREYAVKDPHWFTRFSELLCDTYGGAWDFNEVIGYIEIHIMGNQVRGKYWQDDKKRFVKSRRKQFKYVTHKLVPEVSFPRSADNTQIYQAVLEYVSHCQRYLKSRYIDQSNLTNIGKYVDWKALIKGV